MSHRHISQSLIQVETVLLEYGLEIRITVRIHLPMLEATASNYRKMLQ